MDTLQIISSEEKVYELHLNLWESEKNCIQALDIGIFCPIEDHPYNLTVIIPEKHTKDDFKSLYDKITDSKIASNVFNSYVQVTSGKLCSHAQRCETGNKLDFVLLSIANFYFQDVLGKSEIKIDVPAREKLCEGEETELVDKINKSKYVYFRFRINNIKKSFYSVYSEPISKTFESGYEQNEIVDFRINDAKLLDFDSRKKMLKTHFSKIHFLLICDFEKNVIQCNKTVKPRLFEKAGWGEYLPSSLSQEQRKENQNDLIEQLRPVIVDIRFGSLLTLVIDLLAIIPQKKYKEHTMIAYHMTEKVVNDDHQVNKIKDDKKSEKEPKVAEQEDKRVVKSINTVSFLLKIQWKKTSRVHLFWYAFVIILLAIGANFIYNWLLVMCCRG